MGIEHPKILTVNAGSSSIKTVLFDAQSLQEELAVTITNIGQPSCTLTVHKHTQDVISQSIQAAHHSEAIQSILDYLAEELSFDRLAAIGHRVVHGGQAFSQPVILTNDIARQLKDISIFDPEHMPVILELIEIFSHRFPHITQVACFDTSFYQDLPKVARLLPLPRKLESLGLRRYGFHGLSYESLLNSFREVTDDNAPKGRIILAHLGSGASLTAVKNGAVVDTTMSFTPASGIPMSNRSGDLDPGIIEFLHHQTGMSYEAFNHMVHFESGLLGVSELSADMYVLLQQAANNPKAAEAVDLFCYQVRKAIGSLTTVLGGLDSLIFAGGMGENAPVIRANICEELEYLGVVLDSNRNQSQDFLISSPDSRVGVHLLHANEATVIAAHTQQILYKDLV